MGRPDAAVVCLFLFLLLLLLQGFILFLLLKKREEEEEEEEKGKKGERVRVGAASIAQGVCVVCECARGREKEAIRQHFAGTQCTQTGYKRGDRLRLWLQAAVVAATAAKC